MKRTEIFRSTYLAELKAAIQKMPARFAYGVDKAELVTDRLMECIQNRNYLLTGEALKATCKKLGFKNTYKDIEAYLNGA